ncbi:ankyrin [Penicillium citrinum]|uniref:protein S-acyltransferase n=1 Tax=Penicillium citrinum TaxID=5077 RepID=A0A9W9NIM8_PENCI|nr:ankyrin [Penicillium citrinum]KAJ5220612.1 ankyrin [Penicillium citrinum]
MGLTELPASLLLCIVDHIHSVRDLNSLALALLLAKKPLDRRLYLQARDLVVFRGSAKINGELLDRDLDLDFLVNEVDPYHDDGGVCLTKQYRHVATLRHLLTVYRINHSSKDVKTNLTVLQWAAATNDTEAMRLLLAEKNLPVEDMAMAVHVAAENGCIEAMQLFLTHEEIDLNLNVNGKTAVAAAIPLSPHGDICICTAKRKVCGMLAMDVRARLDYEHDGLPIHMALMNNLTGGDVQQFLNQRGSSFDWTTRDINGDTILHMQTRKTRDVQCRILAETFPWMLEARNHEGLTPLMIAVQFATGRSGVSGNVEVQLCNFLCKRLDRSEKQRQIDYRDKTGNTLLMNVVGKAAYRTPLSMVQALVEGGLDLSARDRYGRTALMHAARCNRDSVVDILLKADRTLINKRDYNGWTAYMWALPPFPKIIREEYYFERKTRTVLLAWGAERVRGYSALLKPITKSLQAPRSAWKRRKLKQAN